MALNHRLANLRLLKRALGAAAFSLSVERGDRQLRATLRKMRARKTLTFAEDWPFARLLEWAAKRYGDRTFIEFEGCSTSFAELNGRANRLALGLRRAGVCEGEGVAIMMGNDPSFLEAFFAAQKLGAYVVPVNTGLVGDGLEYILDHSRVAAVVLDAASVEKVDPLRGKLRHIRRYYLSGDRGDAKVRNPSWAPELDDLDDGDNTLGDVGVSPDPSSPALLMYTSGTTGLPKAVSYAHGNTGLKKLGFASRIFFTTDDKLYTCLPLFHANALMITAMQALWLGIPVALGKRFSASRFWEEVAASGATTFNALGAMIPILLKTAPGPHDKAHRIRRVISSACPTDAWVPFEERFGVKLWEAYGAVDGGGFIVFNAGNAPVGSIGKPGMGAKYKLVNDADQEVAVGESGELVFYAGKNKDSNVEYFRNKEASSKKVRDGWLRTGDLLREDEAGFLYFVGRNTDSMRRRGENVSAYEVEKQVDAHPDVLESAAFGVPSELGEEEIMICVTPLEGREVEPANLTAFLQQRLPKYAVPTYLELVAELPKTGTHRVIKSALKERGVTPSTIRLGG